MLSQASLLSFKEGEKTCISTQKWLDHHLLTSLKMRVIDKKLLKTSGVDVWSSTPLKAPHPHPLSPRISEDQLVLGQKGGTIQLEFLTTVHFLDVEL